MTEQDVETLVVRYLQNVMRESSDGRKQYSGHVDGEEQYMSFLTDLKAIGFSFYSRTSSTNKSSRILFTCEKKNADINIPYFGSPFQIVKSTYMMCSKDGRYTQSPAKLMTDDPTRKTRTSKQPSKKVGCAAFMSVKCLRVFDEECYKLDSPYKRVCTKKKKILEQLNKDLLSSCPPDGTLRFMIIMSPAEDHNHSVVSTNLKQILHPRLRSEIHSFVQRNVCSVKTIKMHLEKVVKGMFENSDRPQPDSMNRCYYPTDHVIRFHMHQGLCTVTKSWYDQAALGECVKTWEEGYVEDNFFFRPYKVASTGTKEEGPSSCTLLFCHQTKWQRDLLSRYGNDISLLDAAYKTCKYSFPLFFIIVKTNAGDCVVGTFVVQMESAALIEEALSQFKAWNPVWDPTYFLTDNSEAEISAVEKSFPQSSVYLCTFHRELSWSRWLNKKGNVPTESITPITELWQAIAASQSEEEYEQNLQVMSCGELCEGGALAMKYFCKEWLPVNQMWVEAFQTKDFLFNIQINDGIECQMKVLEHTYLTNTKDKSLTGVITVILENVLPDIIDKYSISNPPQEYIMFDDSVPEFLRNRPLPFVESVMLWYDKGKEYDASQINDLGEGLFMVRSELNIEEWCSVDFQEATCSCPDFSKWRLPCTHMCAVFIHTPWDFDKLPLWYRENPYITADSYLPEMDEIPDLQTIVTDNNDDTLNFNMDIIQDEEPLEEHIISPDVDVERIWEKSREKLKMILGYTHLQYSTEDVYKFSNTISMLEEEMLSTATTSDETILFEPSEPTLSVQMKKMKSLKHMKRKYLDIPQCSRPKLKKSDKYVGQYGIMANEWHQYTTENGEAIDQIVVIDMV